MLKDLRNHFAEFALLIAILLGAWLIRSRDLAGFKLTDETKWAFRSANFTLALSRGDFSETFQRSHPGVTTMWAGWLGMRTALPDYAEQATRYVENTSYLTDLRENGVEVMQILVPARFAVIAITLLVMVICYFYIARLFNVQAALIGTFLLAFEAFFIGHTRILHVDGFLASFMFLSTIAFLVYMKERKLPVLVVSGVAAGLTWLTKTPGFYLAAGVLSLTVVYIFFQRPGWRKNRLIVDMLSAIWPLALWGAIGVVTFSLLWPAMWVEPVTIIKRLVLESIDYAVGGHSSPVVFNGVVYRDGIIPPSIWQYYPVAYLWRASPFVLLGVLIAGFAVFWKRSAFMDQRERLALLGLVIFALGFIVFMSVGSKRSDRYVLPAFPALCTVAGVGWAALAEMLRESDRSKVFRVAGGLTLLIALIGHLALPFLYLPYYLSYFNPMMGGVKRAPNVLQVGWGEGLDEAARYLNDLPGAKEMTVAAWYERVFSEFFIGRTINIEDLPTISANEIEQILSADYIVAYYHQFQRDMPENLIAILEDQEPIHRLWFNGLEYVRIYDPDTFVR
jgi:hypothetical protein